MVLEVDQLNNQRTNQFFIENVDILLVQVYKMSDANNNRNRDTEYGSNERLNRVVVEGCNCSNRFYLIILEPSEEPSMPSMLCNRTSTTRTLLNNLILAIIDCTGTTHASYNTID